VPGKYHEAYQIGIKKKLQSTTPFTVPRNEWQHLKMYTNYITDVPKQEVNTDINDLTHVPIGIRKTTTGSQEKQTPVSQILR
jgi:hypothetical protein